YAKKDATPGTVETESDAYRPFRPHFAAAAAASATPAAGAAVGSGAIAGGSARVCAKVSSGMAAWGQVTGSPWTLLDSRSVYLCCIPHLLQKRWRPVPRMWDETLTHRIYH
ncbi:unnamed protein product, partial [Pylaiella littoralis]